MTLCSQIVKRIQQFVPDMVAHSPGNADPAWLGERFETRGDIDAVAENVVAFDDHVAKVDADAKLDASIVWLVGIAANHSALDFGGATHRVHDTPEFREKTVAGVFDHTAPLLGDLRIDQLGEMRPHALVRALFVGAHQARVAGHIGGEDRGETADSGHCSPGATKFLQPSLHPKFAKVRGPESVRGVTSRPKGIRRGGPV